jgi:hypothetical protein
MSSSSGVKITVDIDAQKMCDLVVTAIEGGIGYWARNVQVLKSGLPAEYGEVGTYEGGDWEIRGAYPVTDDDSEFEVFSFGPTKFAAGAAKVNRHLGDWVMGNHDAETADVLFQMAAFGERVYA